MLSHKIYWRQLFQHIFFWLFAELTLTVMGVDNIADYIEYLLSRQKLTAIVQPAYVIGSTADNQHIAKSQLLG